MALPKCVGCGGSVLGIRQMTPSGSNFEVTLVLCSNCGVVVGVLESDSVGSILSMLSERLEKIEKRLGV